MFSESSPCLFGQHRSCSTAQRPVELLEDLLQNIFHNLRPQTVWIVRFNYKVKFLGIPEQRYYANSSLHFLLLGFPQDLS